MISFTVLANVVVLYNTYFLCMRILFQYHVETPVGIDVYKKRTT